MEDDPSGVLPRDGVALLLGRMFLSLNQVVRGPRPLVGVDVVMDTSTRDRLAAVGGRAFGRVRIVLPPSADEFTLVTGLSTLGTTAVTALATGVLLTRFQTDPAVIGSYTIASSLNGGNT